jgi:hypothetical protein
LYDEETTRPPSSFALTSRKVMKLRTMKHILH